jgi:hypothetical protein
MPKYVIEREIPGMGNLKPEELQAISQKSCGVLTNMGPQIQWVESFVTRTRFTASTLHPMKKWCVNTPARAGFPPTKSLKSKR